MSAVGLQDSSSPLYLAAEIKNNLFLNLIDPKEPLFQVESFHRAMLFLDNHSEPLIHCNQGLSRAPAIALLWLAKRGYLPEGSYDEAREYFVYPFRPGQGIDTFLRKNWNDLDYRRDN